MDNVLTKDISWVGVHFPEPAPGGAMNQYVIKDDKCALIDTGAPAVASRVLANVRNVVDPTRIDYVILTHADLDHGGGLKEIIAAAPQATVVATQYEAATLPMWGVRANTQVVKDGDTLSLGHHTLRFLVTPHICSVGHMLVFDETDGVLFSGDLFAQLGPREWRVFAESYRVEDMRMVQSFKLGRTEYVQQALARVKELPVGIVAPGHGQVIRGDIAGLAQALSV